jgi:hypothetical protein
LSKNDLHADTDGLVVTLEVAWILGSTGGVRFDRSGKQGASREVFSITLFANGAF